MPARGLSRSISVDLDLDSEVKNVKKGKRAMDKARKGESTRKPPVPSDSHEEIDDWMKRVMPDLQPIVKRWTK